MFSKWLGWDASDVQEDQKISEGERQRLLPQNAKAPNKDILYVIEDELEDIGLLGYVPQQRFSNTEELCENILTCIQQLQSKPQLTESKESPSLLSWLWNGATTDLTRLSWPFALEDNGRLLTSVLRRLNIDPRLYQNVLKRDALLSKLQEKLGAFTDHEPVVSHSKQSKSGI